MSRRILPLFALLLVLLTLLAGPRPLLAAGDTEVAAAMKKAFPQVPVDEVTPSPLKGIYEVVSGNRILYFAPEKNLLLVGEIYTPEGKSLTKERFGKVMAKKIKDLPLDKAVRVGKGEKVVIEVTDPDCPYCRKASQFFATRTDVTRYVFFLPLEMHPNAADKARYILSAADQAKAYEEVMSGKFDQAPLPPFKDNGQLEAHLKVVEHLGITGTPNFWIKDTYVAGADIATLTKLLQ
jgi:thiol:disulfide interchange protein DsbC